MGMSEPRNAEPAALCNGIAQVLRHPIELLEAAYATLCNFASSLICRHSNVQRLAMNLASFPPRCHQAGPCSDGLKARCAKLTVQLTS